MLLACFEQVDDASIESLQNRLALESLAGTQGGVLEIFSRLIPKTADLLKSFSSPLAEFVSPSRESIKLNEKIHKQVITKAKAYPFATFAEMLIMVPEGFHGNLNQYFDYLTKANQEVLKSSNEVMAEYITELSIFLNNVDARKAMKSYDKFYQGIRQKRLVHEKEVSAFFKKNDNRSRAKLGDVLDRFADLEDLFIKAERLKKNENSKELQQLLSQVNHATELLRLMKDKIDTNEIEIVSGDMAKHIAEGAYEAARYVEMVSVSSFATEVALTSVKELAEQLDRTFST